mmetsp:Transcript_12191/g.25586  ORF Transcript_12191/g.25586 Transcript_12191/m.25586 type:complete len:423 (-) Transcript_12191:1524-2792(-)
MVKNIWKDINDDLLLHCVDVVLFMTHAPTSFSMTGWLNKRTGTLHLCCNLNSVRPCAWHSTGRITLSSNANLKDTTKMVSKIIKTLVILAVSLICLLCAVEVLRSSVSLIRRTSEEKFSRAPEHQRVTNNWITYQRTCPPKVRDSSGSVLAALVKRDKRVSACADAAWYHQIFAYRCPRVIIDIGANKGYWSLEKLRYFDIDVAVLRERLLQKWAGVTGHCGACRECSDTLVQETVCPAPEFHLIEASSLTASVLRDVFNYTHQVSVHAKVMARKSGSVYFSEGGFGSERNSLSTSKRSEGDVKQTLAWSVDDFVQHQGINEIDVLKIDAEGYDPDVLRGASATLGKVNVLEFEYHAIGRWKENNLRSITEELNVRWGFVCYFMLKKSKLIQITKCWDERMELRRWSNVVCFSDRLLTRFAT